MTAPDMDESLDWLGRRVDCTVCRFADRLSEERCQPLKACVHDRYAKRIQRVLALGPQLGMSDEAYAKVMSFNLRLLKKMGRA